MDCFGLPIHVAGCGRVRCCQPADLSTKAPLDHWTVASLDASAVVSVAAVPVDPWDAVAGLEVVEAAAVSAESREVVALG